MTMLTESGCEEFILFVRGEKCWCYRRDDGQSGHERDNVSERAWTDKGWKIVKVYMDYSNGHYGWNPGVLNVEIGYHEQRLTPVERLAARLYVAHYWEIPF